MRVCCMRWLGQLHSSEASAKGGRARSQQQVKPAEGLNSPTLGEANAKAAAGRKRMGLAATLRTTDQRLRSRDA